MNDAVNYLLISIATICCLFTWIAVLYQDLSKKAEMTDALYNEYIRLSNERNKLSTELNSTLKTLNDK